MYAPRPTRPENRPDYATTRAATSRILHAAQPDFERHQALTVGRAPDAPLTGLDRLGLASACSVLADAFDRAADLWDRHRPGLPIADGYRSAARQLRADAALHEAVADIAPSVPAAGW